MPSSRSSSAIRRRTGSGNIESVVICTDPSHSIARRHFIWVARLLRHRSGRRLQIWSSGKVPVLRGLRQKVELKQRRGIGWLRRATRDAAALRSRRSVASFCAGTAAVRAAAAECHAVPVALQRRAVAVGARVAPWLRSRCLWPAAPRALRASRRRRRSKKGRPRERSERRPGSRDAPKLLQRDVAARHVGMRCAAVDSAGCACSSSVKDGTPRCADGARRMIVAPAGLQPQP